MKLFPTRIAGLAVADTTRIADARGDFARLFCESDLAAALGGRHIVQMNHARTLRVGAVRGMHFQRPPHAEMKLVRCIRGRVWDVALDLRAGSATLLSWHAEELSADNGRMLVIPEGFAHGLQVLEPGSEILYLHTTAYVPEAEGGVRHDDPRAAIAWPLAVTDISERDRAFASLAADFAGMAP